MKAEVIKAEDYGLEAAKANELTGGLNVAKAEREEKERIEREEKAKRETLEAELRAKEEAERKVKEQEEAQIQLELNKGDSDKVKDLKSDLIQLKSKYTFKSKKNQKMYSDVGVLIEKVINHING